MSWKIKLWGKKTSNYLYLYWLFQEHGIMGEVAFDFHYILL